MISKNKDFEELKKLISREAHAVREIGSLMNSMQSAESEEKEIILEQLKVLEETLRETNNRLPEALENVNLIKPLKKEILRKRDLFFYHRPGTEKEEIEEKPKIDLTDFEKETLKRIKLKREKEAEKKKSIRKPNKYVGIANRFFSKYTERIAKLNMFKDLGRDLVKANIEFMPKSYIAIMLLTVSLSFFASLVVFFFFLFFNVTPVLPIITLSTDNFFIRLLKVFWIPIIIPLGVFLFLYFYPSLERDSVGNKINHELPFATINMAAISGSLIEPTKIFSIIVSTREYPNLEKEFIRIVNNVNVLGQDLVTSLRNGAFNSASKKLVDLLNGLATNITSGGNMFNFFDEKAKSLLFEYNLEKEKSTRAAETFMDIYISVVIAAPMIIMLLLLMMRISGLGVSLSTSAITIIMVLGVSVINVIFLAFLSLRQQSTGG